MSGRRRRLRHFYSPGFFNLLQFTNSTPEGSSDVIAVQRENETVLWLLEQEVQSDDGPTHSSAPVGSLGVATVQREDEAVLYL